MPFVKKQPKEFRQFRLIEIQNETEVHEIASFIYPFWKGQIQCIYFSEDGEFMYERLFFQRYLIYKKVNIEGGFCSW